MLHDEGENVMGVSFEQCEHMISLHNIKGVGLLKKIKEMGREEMNSEIDNVIITIFYCRAFHGLRI